jgi:hypothetical protein
MSDTCDNQIETERINGRFAPGHSGNPFGRPKGISLLSILKEKLQKTILTDEGEISLAETMIEAYLRKAVETNDGIALRDLIDRIDGKPVQSVNVKTDKLNELAESFKEIAKETDE